MNKDIVKEAKRQIKYNVEIVGHPTSESTLLIGLLDTIEELQKANVAALTTYNDLFSKFEEQASQITKLQKALLRFKKQYPLSPWIRNQVEEALAEPGEDNE